MSQTGVHRLTRYWMATTVAVAVGVTLAGCSGGSTVRTTGSPSSASATTAQAEGSSSSGDTALSEAVAYSQCIRNHGVPNFPDPVQTPSGGYGYRTVGINPNSASFQGALQACEALPSPWNTTGEQLSSAQQQAWLNWAQCIRSHGVPDFPDPTFSGNEVHDSAVGSSTPQLQQAMNACMSQRPSVGGLGG